jgi:hypothetical protein
MLDLTSAGPPGSLYVVTGNAVAPEGVAEVLRSTPAECRAAAARSSVHFVRHEWLQACLAVPRTGTGRPRESRPPLLPQHYLSWAVPPPVTAAGAHAAEAGSWDNGNFEGLGGKRLASAALDAPGAHCVAKNGVTKLDAAAPPAKRQATLFGWRESSSTASKPSTLAAASSAAGGGDSMKLVGASAAAEPAAAAAGAIGPAAGGCGSDSDAFTYPADPAAGTSAGLRRAAITYLPNGVRGDCTGVYTVPASFLLPVPHLPGAASSSEGGGQVESGQWYNTSSHPWLASPFYAGPPVAAAGNPHRVDSTGDRGVPVPLAALARGRTAAYTAMSPRSFGTCHWYTSPGCVPRSRVSPCLCGIHARVAFPSLRPPVELGG